jgi:Domain of unknown function (DUF5666)
MKKAAKMIAAGMSTVALAGGIGMGIAYADPDPTPRAKPTAGATISPTASPTTKADRKAEKSSVDRQRRGWLRRALHGEATLAGKKHQVVAFQRGAVETVSGASLTVRSEDGFTATYLLNAETRIRKDGHSASLSDIKVADQVRVRATKDGSTLTARAVRARPA